MLHQCLHGDSLSQSSADSEGLGAPVWPLSLLSAAGGGGGGSPVVQNDARINLEFLGFRQVSFQAS